MNVWLKKLWWLLRDRVYPGLQPLSKEAADRELALAQEEQEKCDAQIKTLPDDDNLLTQYLSGCARLLDEAEDTRRSVEARLTSTIGLSSIAGTIVFGAILALATRTLHVDSFPLRLLITIGALYLVLQIFGAILASLCGLERRGYIAARASDVLPSSHEARPVCLRHQIALYTRRLGDERSNNRAKVDQMALAQRAMRNFIGGLTLLAVIGTGFALTARNPSDDLIQTLRKNHALYEMLRGPQDPKGDPSPPGPAPEPTKKQQPPPWRIVPSLYDPFWSNWALVIAAIVAGVAAMKTLRAIKRQTGILINSERAWITVGPEHGNPDLITSPKRDDGIPNNIFVATIRNIGKSPAQITDMNAWYVKLDKMEDLAVKPDYEKSQNLEGMILVPNDFIAQGQSLLPDSCLTQEEEVKIRNAKMFLYAYGFVNYKDAFGNRRYTRWGYLYSFPQGNLTVFDFPRFQRAGPPEYNKAT
jgi:hypothetical protein